MTYRSASSAASRSSASPLPTAAEWERAAGDTRFPWGDAWADDAAVTVIRLSGPLKDEADWRRFLEGYEGADPSPEPATSPTRNRTARGVVHLHGNVAEWTADPVEGRPGLRIVKGVGITSRDYAAPSKTRVPWPVNHRDQGLGFRCAR